MDQPSDPRDPTDGGTKQAPDGLEFASVLAPRFPCDWVGLWRGLCYLSAPGETLEAVRLELRIEPIARPDGSLPPGPQQPPLSELRAGDTYAWITLRTRGKGTAATREQHSECMTVVDVERGEFALVRENGDTVPVYDMMGPLMSISAAGGQQIVCRYLMDDLRSPPLITVEALSFDPAAGAARQAGAGAWKPSTLQSWSLLRAPS